MSPSTGALDIENGNTFKTHGAQGYLTRDHVLVCINPPHGTEIGLPDLGLLCTGIGQRLLNRLRVSRLSCAPGGDRRQSCPTGNKEFTHDAYRPLIEVSVSQQSAEPFLHIPGPQVTAKLKLFVQQCIVATLVNAR